MTESDENFLGSFFANHFSGVDEADKELIAKLFQSAREGHLCMHAKGYPLPKQIASSGKEPFPKIPIVCEQDRYYLQRNWVFETQIAKHLKRLSAQKHPASLESSLFEKAIDEEEKLSSDQKKAAKHFYSNPFSILCGGPGTGKTHTIAYFLKAMPRKKDYRILLGSPTGKAALHLQESIIAKVKIDIPAMTLHRMLGLRPGKLDLFSKRRIDADLIIVDEAAMMDVSLLLNLLAKVGDHTRLILMGDPNQLPPVVGSGVFAEIADIYGVFLKKCMRTENVHLQQISEAILASDETAFFSNLDISEDFDDGLIDFLYEKIAPNISSQKINPEKFLEERKKFCILNMLRKGPFGLKTLNQKILARFSKDCPDDFWWAIPIMGTANLPEHDVYNGSSGVLIGQKRGKFSLLDGTAYFSGKAFCNPPPYEISFVLSVHKSQGSEFDEVLALFPQGSESFGKEALYTAATRAKKSWQVFGSMDVLRKILMQKTQVITGLKSRLKSCSKDCL